MKWFIDNDWTWNSLQQRDLILERHPDSVEIELHLAVCAIDMSLWNKCVT